MNLSDKCKRSGLAKPVIALSCLGFLVSGMAIFSGCGGGASTTKEVKKEAPLSMAVQQLEQRSNLDDKVPDGQYLIAKVMIKNTSNNTISLDPADFALQNITDNEKERYTQPAERGMTAAFGNVYGDELKSKLMDFDTSNLYPRLEIERYFVFMVPSDAAVNGYQLTYKPAKISVPLVTPEVTVNDHRTEAIPSNDNQFNKP